MGRKKNFHHGGDLGESLLGAKDKNTAGSDRGSAPYGTRSSSLSRRLLLLTFIDAALSAFLWIYSICTTIETSQPINETQGDVNSRSSGLQSTASCSSDYVIRSQITSYSVGHSLFDIVVMAVLRFLMFLFIEFVLFKSFNCSRKFEKSTHMCYLWSIGLLVPLLIAKCMVYRDFWFISPGHSGNHTGNASSLIAPRSSRFLQLTRVHTNLQLASAFSAKSTFNFSSLLLAVGSTLLITFETFLMALLVSFARPADEKLYAKKLAREKRLQENAVYSESLSSSETSDNTSSSTSNSEMQNMMDGVQKNKGTTMEESDSEDEKTSSLTTAELIRIFKPYFWPRSTKNKGIAVLTYCVMVGGKACGVISPMFIKYAANDVQSCLSDSANCRLDSHYMHSAMMHIIYFCLLTFAQSGLQQLQSIVYLFVKQTAFVEISQETYRHLHSLSYEWYIRKELGTVIRCLDRGITSADNVVNYLFLYLFPTIIQCFVVFGIFYTQFSNPDLAAVAFLSFVIYIILTIVLTQWRKKFRQLKNKSDDKFHAMATDALMNYETVKYFANEEYEIKRYSKAVDQYQNYNVSTRASLSLLNASQQFVCQACLAIALILEARVLIGSNGLTDLRIGDFMAVNVYIAQLYAPLNFLGTIYAMIVQAFIDLEKLSNLLAERPDVVDSSDAIPFQLQAEAHEHGLAVEFENLAFHYPKQAAEKGLNNVSFKVPAGTVTALVGSTGSGKTTIGRLLFRFFDPQQGCIRLDGHDISTLKQGDLRKNIGVVPQDTVLFNDTILANIAYGKIGASMEEIERAAKNAQLLDFILAQPKGWDTVVGERGLRLSGGEKQRVAVARALLKDPPVVLLDEATSALDMATERQVQLALEKLGRNRTQIVIAHRLSTIMGANQIIVLEKGRIIEVGTHQELLDRKGKYYQLWGEQSETL